MEKKKTKQKREMDAYSEAVSSRLYEKQSGLVGKYDNVRRYWEDEITRQFIMPHLSRLLDRCHAKLRRLNILDFGCGSADGYELLGGIRQREANLQEHEVHLLSPENLGIYKGTDLNEDLLAQAAAIYGHNPKMVFEKFDFTQPFRLAEGERPYDLYFTSYGTCSHHNEDRTMVNLLADIAGQTRDYSLIVCDWIGRYSYEWQTLWTDDPAALPNMDYVVSYIYSAEERARRRRQLQHLTLRLVSRGEAEDMARQAGEKAGIPVKPLVFFDRSIFTGRHMDTREYNPFAQPIRTAVNSLHETNIRTDLNSVLLDYHPRPGFDVLNNCFEHIQVCWNTLVGYTNILLNLYDQKQQRYVSPPPAIPSSYPPPLREMMERLRSVVEDVGWLEIGLPRERIIEPQLGYSLRHLVSSLQQGLGMAHGLVGIFEVDRSR